MQATHSLPHFFSSLRRHATEMRSAAVTNLQELVNDSRFELLGLMTVHCRHTHLGWPRHGRQTCLDCGRSWEYDWQMMQRHCRERQPRRLHFRIHLRHTG